MLKSGLRLPLLILLVVALFTCIDPYFPKLDNYKQMLVVEGLVTNDHSSFTIKLSLSKQENDTVSSSVNNAVVYISDEDGNLTNLSEYKAGIYKTDSLVFKAEVGKIYQLHIKTSNGNEYASDSCQMFPVPEIDTVYFEKDVKFLNNQTVSRKGISLYLDSKPGEGEDNFIRWDFEETWKFKVPLPAVYKYINKDTIPPLPVNEVHEYCFKSSNSSGIITGEMLSGNADNAKKIPIQFISPEETDRLTIRYSILINQYSISKKEFSFWNDLKKVNESKGDIFGSQPFAVLSNVKNINDPSEVVLGYFQVSAVTHKRKFIDFNETIPLDLPFYHYPCSRIKKAPSDYQTGFGPPITFDDVYNMFLSVAGYTFIEPIYDQGSGDLFKLVFTSTECADCRVTGSAKIPDFWIE
jgi:hypothetical protein